MFDPRRFARLARAHLAEHGRNYAWFLAGGILLELVVSILNFVGKDGFNDFTNSGQKSYFYIGLFLLAPIFAGRYFQSMASKAPALLALMRPASVFEKWLLALLVIVVLYPLAYALGYYLVMIPDWLLASFQAKQHAAQMALEYARHSQGDKPGAFDPETYRLFLPWRDFDNWRDLLQLALWVLSLQGFAVFGSLYFRSVPFIKTVLVALLFLLLIGVFSGFAGGDPNLVLSYWGSKRPMSGLQNWGYAMLWFGFPGMLWLACYLGLKEREIAA